MIEFSKVGKIYLQGQNALQRISFIINNGEMVYLTGHSGAGKSTLLRIIAAMEKVSIGNVLLNGQDITDIKPKEIPKLRRKIGMVFQDHHLMMGRTVAENVALPLLIHDISLDEIIPLVSKAIDRVGLKGKGALYPINLSTGEQQRVGIARAIIAKPLVLLADEPTGNLDAKLSTGILDLFSELNQEGMTIMMATHDIELIRKQPRRTLHLQQGHLIADGMFDLRCYNV
jgi:cell division transport system ATP-binding protein